MKIICTFLFALIMAFPAFSFSPDFISRYIENSKLAYADNGYRVVHEKTFYASEIDQDGKTIACQLDPGEYFAQLITEPCFKLNMEVQGEDKSEPGIVSEKPELRNAIAIFDVHEKRNGADNSTHIKLACPKEQICFPAKARLLVYQRIAF